MASSRSHDSKRQVQSLPYNRHHKRPAANIIFGVGNGQTKGIPELAEEILLHFDVDTLYDLKVSGVPECYEVIDASGRLKKKLFLTQPTLEDAVALGLVEDATMVASIGPGEVMVLNPWLFVDESIWYDGKRLVAKFQIRVVADALSSRREKSPWEGMFAHTKLEEDSPYFGCDLLYVVDEVIDYRLGRYSEGETYVKDDWRFDDALVRDVMDSMEEAVLNEEGVTFSWSKARFDWPGWVMSYWTYQMLCERAENQVAGHLCTKWEDVSRWDRIRSHLRWSPEDMDEDEVWNI